MENSGGETLVGKNMQNCAVLWCEDHERRASRSVVVAKKELKWNRKIMRNFFSLLLRGASNLINSRNNETSDYPWFISPSVGSAGVAQRKFNILQKSVRENFMWPLCKCCGEVMNKFQAEFNYQELTDLRRGWIKRWSKWMCNHNKYETIFFPYSHLIECFLIRQISQPQSGWNFGHSLKNTTVNKLSKITEFLAGWRVQLQIT